MSEITRPSVATVRQVLREVYGDNETTEELSYEIVDWWGGWVRQERDGSGRTVGEELYIMLWNWFPGDDSAGYATDRILETVESDTLDSEG